MTPSRSRSYAIVGVGGFLGVGERDVAVPVSKFKQQMGKIVLPGATKDKLMAAPKFEHAKSRFVTSSRDIHLSPGIHKMKFARSDALSRPRTLVNHVKLRARARAIAMRVAPRSRALACRANSAFLAAIRTIDPGAAMTVACRHADRTACSGR